MIDSVLRYLPPLSRDSHGWASAWSRMSSGS